MCANYTPPPPRALRDRLPFVQRLPVAEPAFGYPAEVWPMGEAPVLWLDPAATGAPLVPRLARFGLLPGWARDDKLMRQTYNARSETVAEKPSFRSAWRKRQFCLIPVQAFYEPNYEGGRAPVRWRIERGDGAPFCVAGLWEMAWREQAATSAPPPAATLSLFDDEESRPAPLRRQVWSFTMLTVTAQGHALMGRFHAPQDEKRSIVMLDAEQSLAWLRAGQDDDEALARALLQALPAAEFVSAASPRTPRRPEPAQSSAPSVVDGRLPLSPRGPRLLP
jgi:putative SOS response-associated peptidase YedK